MNTQKAMATTPHVLEAMAIDILQVRFYNKSDCLSSRVNYLLAGLLFGLQHQHLNPLEHATVLDFIDGLIRLKVDCGLIRRKRNAS